MDDKTLIDKPRLIERGFPLKQASLDSVHEKNVRHGHISTLHIWPARRPLAACRAALIATLLPDPGDPDEMVIAHSFHGSACTPLSLSALRYQPSSPSGWLTAES